ncbi:hypothetical protein UWK_00993 [Desulfocapsa sulfexigens DSM 10523]|uniref:Uncharacterized protein n=1 Tax=Desulfocapsa sulfexigens (strain DSM 10523 / SB164P1) TaxID=1167006 RepID=M1P799_DESSD|nr:hypothetical protein [Desulfocapsa sulfexigens]AGF77567.1 hypothetical protein UWK_00993 [Desulfocapsa sulfexigens DSM 10523]
MKKTIWRVLEVGVLLLALFVPGGMNNASAEIHVSINIGPPPIMVAEPPAVVMIPNSTIYFVPQAETDMFFYDNYWWRPRGSQWYRSNAYNGSWESIGKHHVPAPLYQLPKDYRHRYEKEHHIPYGQWKKQWSDQGKKDHDDKGKSKQDKQNRGHGKKGD